MKIAVCVKQVPDATVHKKIDPQTKRLDRSGEAALNPTDLNAVEEALRIKEAQGGEVVGDSVVHLHEQLLREGHGARRGDQLAGGQFSESEHGHSQGGTQGG